MHAILRNPADTVVGCLLLACYWLGQAVALAALNVAVTLITWQERARSRRRLQSLDDRMLADVGLSRADVMREVSKPFWHG